MTPTKRLWRKNNPEKVASYSKRNETKESTIAYRKEYVARNKERMAKRDAMKYAANREEVLAKKKAYNRRIREAQAPRPRPTLCEVCKRPSGKKALHWDHEHSLGGFRGWICTKCNAILGYADDNPEILEALAFYLRAHWMPL
jgi:hypothetical protein